MVFFFFPCDFSVSGVVGLLRRYRKEGAAWNSGQVGVCVPGLLTAGLQ